jgi:tetratricopeptide (TPR) repeat protein
LIYKHQRKIDKAMQILKESLNIQESIGHLYGQALCKLNMAIIWYEEKANRKKAVPLFLQAYHIFKELKSPDQKIALNYLETIKSDVGEKKFWRMAER